MMQAYNAETYAAFHAAKLQELAQYKRGQLNAIKQQGKLVALGGSFQYWQHAGQIYSVPASGDPSSVTRFCAAGDSFRRYCWQLAQKIGKESPLDLFDVVLRPDLIIYPT